MNTKLVKKLSNYKKLNFVTLQDAIAEESCDDKVPDLHDRVQPQGDEHKYLHKLFDSRDQLGQL
jgi:hypothetical protein